MSTKTVALITGANKGLGLETARQLARLGIKVLIGARDEARGNEAVQQLRNEKLEARFIQIEVTSQASIDRAAADIGREFGKLDILINNAGVMKTGMDGPGSAVSQETLRSTFDTNFFGLIAVTQTMLPLLRKSEAGRIVNLSSVLGSIAEHADPNSTIFGVKLLAYDASKSALNMFTNHLAHELRGTNIKVNAAHPGWVKTDMGGPDAPMEQVDGARTSVWLATLPKDGPSGGYFHMMNHLRW